MLEACFTKVAEDRRFHPVRDYLKSLPPWDGECRVEMLFIRCLQAEDTPYTRAVARKVMAAAVARIMEPGVKFDSIPVLDGAQGIGKSSLFRELAGSEYYSETLSLTDMSDKSGAEKLQGFWIVEIGELAGMRKADIEKVKAFLSTSDDVYRPSYGRVVESHPRQCVIVATVNGERGYLRDTTGNRRFWVVKCNQTEQARKFSFTPEERDQIWAEALWLWDHGEKLYLEDDLRDEAEQIQRSAMEEDDRQGLAGEGAEGQATAEDGSAEAEAPDDTAQEEEPQNTSTPFMVFDSSGTLRYDAHVSDGQVVDSYGNPIDGCYVNENGNVVDAYWNEIDPATGQLAQ